MHVPLSGPTNGPYAIGRYACIQLCMCAGATAHALLNRGKTNQLGQMRVSVGGCDERYGEPMRSSI